MCKPGAIHWLNLFLVVILALAEAGAQINRASIEGVVTDPQGAVVQGAAVSATSADTNVTVRTRANDAGYFRFSDLLPGQYTVEASGKGFGTLKVSGVKADAGKQTRVDLALSVASAEQVVEVNSNNSVIDEGSANLSTTISAEEVMNVPLQGRDLQQLVFLVPGIASVAGPPGSNFGFNSQFGTSPDPTYLLGSAVAVNGGQSGSNAWYLDGNLNISGFGENIVVNPSPDSVQEFQAVTSGISAEYGRTSGGVFNVVLKSGTKDFHGSLYEYVRNDATNALNPFTRQNSNRIRFNNFGGTVGGPIVNPFQMRMLKRSFFFVSWDASILHEIGKKPFSVPTSLMRQGDFSEDPNIAQYGIYDPESTVGPNSNTGLFSRQQFSGTTIPNGRLDPLAMFFVNSFPSPNYSDPLVDCPPSADGFKICNNFLGEVGSSQDVQNISVKYDNQLTDSNKLFVEWLYSPTKVDNYKVPWTGASFPWSSVGWSSSYPLDLHDQIVAIGDTNVFTPTLLNEFRLSFSRQFLTTNPSQPYPDNVTDQKGVQSALQASGIPTQAPYPFPQFNVTSPGYMTWGPTPYVNMTQAAEAYTLIDNVTKIMGRNSIKSGLLYRLEHAAYETGFPTQINFSGAITSDPVTGFGGDALAQFMLGDVSDGDSSTAGIMKSPYTSWHSWAFFGQDDFRATDRLSLNLGLRYELNGYFKDRRQPMANFCFTCENGLTGLPGQIVYSGDPSFPNGPIAQPNKNSIAPRFNFSLLVGSKRETVVHGGFDVLYTDGISNLNAPGQSAVNASGWNRNGAWTGSQDPGQCAPFSGGCVAWKLSDTNSKEALLYPSISNPEYPAQLRENTLGGAYAFTKPSHDPVIQTWSLEIEQKFSKTIGMSIGYAGSHGTHLPGESFWNYSRVSTATKLKYETALNENVPITNFFTGTTAQQLGLLYQSPGSNSPATELPISALVASYPFYNLGGLYTNTLFDGTSSYNGLNVRLQKSTSSGLDFLAAYTFSKKMGNWGVGQVGSQTTDPIHYTRSGGFGGRAGLVGNGGNAFAPAYQDPDNKRMGSDGHVIASDDIPQMFNFAASYELPVGQGRQFLQHGGLINSVVGGWKLTGNLNAESGVPLAVTAPCTLLQSSIAGNCRPNLLGNPSTKGESKSARIAQWIKPSAFEPAFGSDPTYWANPDPNDPRSWLFGNAPVRLSNLLSPGFWNLDSSLSKSFKIQGERSAEFRWEVYNSFNHPNPGLPNTSYCLPPTANGSTDLVHQAGCQFGQITNVQTDPRSMQFSLKFHL